MRILVSGALGFVGASLVASLRSKNHEVVALSRQPVQGPYILWDPAEEKIEQHLLEGFDAVIHLAGEPLSLSRWSSEKKRKIFDSRVKNTQFLCSQLSSLKKAPSVFISASAVGFYGDRGEELLDETSGKGSGFLSDVCDALEQSTISLKKKGVRIVHARFGIVLGNEGRAIKKLLPMYRLGLGAVLGTGLQWMSWIDRDDLINAIIHVLQSELQGAINFVSPHCIRQKNFSYLLAKLLHKPHIFKIPSFLLTFLLGDVAREMLLASAKVSCSKLHSSGFRFQYPTIQQSLEKILQTRFL